LNPLIERALSLSSVLSDMFTPRGRRKRLHDPGAVYSAARPFATPLSANGPAPTGKMAAEPDRRPEKPAYRL
jgi:hypothetical protein